MRKNPPVPEPPGHAYCFVCAKLLPEAAFPLRGGKLSRPCRECKRTARERNAPLRAILQEAAERIEAAMSSPRTYVAERHTPTSTERFMRWHEQRQAEAIKAARKAARGAPKEPTP